MNDDDDDDDAFLPLSMNVVLVLFGAFFITAGRLEFGSLSLSLLLLRCWWWLVIVVVKTKLLLFFGSLARLRLWLDLLPNRVDIIRSVLCCCCCLCFYCDLQPL